MVTVTEAAQTRREARPVRRRRRVKAAPYLFVAPFVLVFAAFSAYPIFFALQLSEQEKSDLIEYLKSL